MKRGVGQLETTMSWQGSAYGRAGVSIPTFHRTHESELVWRIQVLQCGSTITEDKLTNTSASGDKMTGDAPTARTGLAFCGTLVGPGKNTHGTTMPQRREALGGPQRDGTTRPRLQRTSWLPTWWQIQFVETADLRSTD